MAYIIVAINRNTHMRENIDNAKDRIEAEYLTEEYSLAFGPSFHIKYIEASARLRRIASKRN